MAKLTELPELVGFFSYSRDDDRDSDGSLSALRQRIQGEVRGQLGRHAETFRLWQDNVAIPSGTLWEEQIKTAVSQSVFFIPIITPTVVTSPNCKFELDLFLAREAQLGRDDLVFPLLYIDVPELSDEQLVKANPILSTIAKRQYLDWRSFRHQDVSSTALKQEVARFGADICRALRRTWQSPEESRKIAEAAALAKQQQDEADAKRRREETEAERQREDEEKKRRDETVRAITELVARRRASEAQRLKEEEEKREKEGSAGESNTVSPSPPQQVAPTSDEKVQHASATKDNPVAAQTLAAVDAPGDAKIHQIKDTKPIQDAQAAKDAQTTKDAQTAKKKEKDNPAGTIAIVAGVVAVLGGIITAVVMTWGWTTLLVAVVLLVGGVIVMALLNAGYGQQLVAAVALVIAASVVWNLWTGNCAPLMVDLWPGFLEPLKRMCAQPEAPKRFNSPPFRPSLLPPPKS